MTEIAKHHTIAPHEMRRVILESPFSGDVEANLTYARACIRDSLLRGEAPQASHCLYTQPGVLDDNQPLERAHGINAGHAWLRAADAMVVYTDRGISDGMRAGINTATFNRIPIEYRVLPDAQEPAENAANVVLETNAAFVRSEP
jgi:hypothetical protein